MERISLRLLLFCCCWLAMAAAQAQRLPFDGNRVLEIAGKSPQDPGMPELRAYLATDPNATFSESLWFSRAKGLEITFSGGRVSHLFVHGKSPYNYGTQPFQGTYPLGISPFDSEEKIVRQLGEPDTRESWGALRYFVEHEGKVYNISIEINTDKQSVKHTVVKLDDTGKRASLSTRSKGSAGTAQASHPFDGNRVLEIAGKSPQDPGMPELRAYLATDPNATFSESLWFSRAKGLEISFSDGRVSHLFVHGKSPYNYGTQPFQGTYPLGISPFDSEDKIVRQLGEPNARESWGLRYFVEHEGKVYNISIDINTDKQSVKHTVVKLDDTGKRGKISTKHHGTTPGKSAGSGVQQEASSSGKSGQQQAVASDAPSGAKPSGVGCVAGDCYQGMSTYVWETGSWYVGEYYEGKREGYGIFYFSNGDRYAGEWNDGERDGTGTYWYASEGQFKKYMGEWIAGKRSGIGLMEYQSGETRLGEWKDNEFVDEERKGCLSGDCQNSYSDFVWDSGTRYSGAFRNGMPEGKGSCYYPNGGKYVGDFVNGQPAGNGVFYAPNGEKFEGEWLNGQMHGQGRYWTLDGRTGKGRWEEGKMLE